MAMVHAAASAVLRGADEESPSAVSSVGETALSGFSASAAEGKSEGLAFRFEYTVAM